MASVFLGIAYFEGGPLDGQVQQLTGSYPPQFPVQVPGKEPVEVHALGDPEPKFVSVETVFYHRELAPHRAECVTYFFEERERDRAYAEDTREDPSDMLELCQPPLTTRASTLR